MSNEKSVIIGGDHRALELLTGLSLKMKESGWKVEERLPTKGEKSDYPIVAEAVGKRVSSGAVKWGILACGSGIGVSMAANKIAGIRAALVVDEHAAEGTRRHNDANIICFAADTISIEQSWSVVQVFLNTDFDGGRHSRRVNQMAHLDS